MLWRHLEEHMVTNKKITTMKTVRCKMSFLCLFLLALSINSSIAQESESKPLSLTLDMGYKYNSAHHLADFHNVDQDYAAVEVTYAGSIGFVTEMMLGWDYKSRLHFNLGIKFQQYGLDKISEYCNDVSLLCTQSSNNIRSNYVSPLINIQYDVVKREKYSVGIASGVMVDFFINTSPAYLKNRPFVLKRRSYAAIFSADFLYHYSKTTSPFLSFYYQTALTSHNVQVNKEDVLYYPYSLGINFGLKFKL